MDEPESELQNKEELLQNKEELERKDFRRLRKQLRVVSFRTRPKDLDMMNVESDTDSVEDLDLNGNDTR